MKEVEKQMCNGNVKMKEMLSRDDEGKEKGTLNESNERGHKC